MTATEFKKQLLPHYRRMYAVAMTMLHNSDDASDMVQEAFTKLWEKRDELQNIDNTEAYCVTVIKRICIDRIRNYNEQTCDYMEQTNLMTNDADDIRKIIEGREKLQIVKALINNLPEQQRNILKLRAIGECSFEEIQKLTGLSDVNARTLLSRARRRLKELYNNYIG